MNGIQKYVYLEEISLHCQLAFLSHEEFRKIIDNPETRQSRLAWLHLQSFLSHVGMVSKLLFYKGKPTKKISKDRAKTLQDLLDISDESPLNNREARNAIEHLDERLDEWLESPEKGCLENIFPDREGFNFVMKNKGWIARRIYIYDEDIFATQKGGSIVETEITPILEELHEVFLKAQICMELVKRQSNMTIIPGTPATT